MRQKPFAFFTLTTKTGERINRRFNCRFGFELQRVSFADHRSGWSGIKLHLYLIFWYWGFCLVRWRTPPYTRETVYSLQEQLRNTHGDRWADYDRRMAEQEEEESRLLSLQTKIVQEGIRRMQAGSNDAENDQHHQ